MTRFAAALGLVLFGSASAEPKAPTVREGVTERAHRDGAVDVIVVLEPTLTAADLAQELGDGLVATHRLLPHALAGRVTVAGVERLRLRPGVRAVQLDSVGHPSLVESARAIHGDRVITVLGVTGSGVTVAALDTGVDARHPDLDGGIDGGLLAEHCFAKSACPPGMTDEGDTAPEGSGHGTHIAGILTGDGRVAPRGIAPGAPLVMVRVFNGASLGYVSDWVAGLEWVLARHATLGVRVVNLSLGTDEVYGGSCDTQQPAMADVITRLRAAGVVTFVASGNDGADGGMNAPACISSAVAVGATYDSDLGREPDNGTYACGCADARSDAGIIACYSNSSTELDLLAPGSNIRSTASGGGVTEKHGTSQAVAHASAAAALMLEVDPLLQPDDVVRLLKSTGSPRTDTRNGVTAVFIDAAAAVEGTKASWCARRTDGAACPLEGLDGGAPRPGSCQGGSCAITVGAIAPFPAADGCSAVGGGTALALGALLWRRLTARGARRERGREG